MYFYSLYTLKTFQQDVLTHPGLQIRNVVCIHVDTKHQSMSNQQSVRGSVTIWRQFYPFHFTLYIKMKWGIGVTYAL